MPEDFNVTSKNAAEYMAHDRLDPFMWLLRGRIEARITSEWFPGTEIVLELNDIECVVAGEVAAHYEQEGWTVTIGKKRSNSVNTTITLK